MELLLSAFSSQCECDGASMSASLYKSAIDAKEKKRSLKTLLLDNEPHSTVHSLLHAAAAYPHATNLHIWRCGIGDAGLNALSRLLLIGRQPVNASSTSPCLRMVDVSADAFQRTRTELSERSALEAQLANGDAGSGPSSTSRRQNNSAAASTRSKQQRSTKEEGGMDCMPAFRSDAHEVAQKMPYWTEQQPAFSSDALRKLARAITLGGSVSVTYLVLERDALGDAEVSSLCESLAGNPTLRSLRLGGNSISVDGARSIGRLLQPGQSSISILHLNGNKYLRDDGASAVLEAAMHSNILTTLDLASCSISGSEGFQKAALTLISRHPTLSHLDMHHNIFSCKNNFVQEVADALQKNLRIKTLLITHYTERSAIQSIRQITKQRRRSLSKRKKKKH